MLTIFLLGGGGVCDRLCGDQPCEFPEALTPRHRTDGDDRRTDHRPRRRSSLPPALVRPSKDRVQCSLHHARRVKNFDGEDDGTTINDDERDDGAVAAPAMFVRDELEEFVCGPSFLPEGKPEGYFVVRHHSVPPDGLGDPEAHGLFRERDVSRLGLRSTNMTLPSALMVLDPEAYPTLPHALRACRKGRILLHRGPLPLATSAGMRQRRAEGGATVRNESGGPRPSLSPTLDFRGCSRGRVWDRVHPDDVVAVQAPGSIGGAYDDSDPPRRPPFELPVVFEDDHLAIVNKPGGVSVHPHRNEGGKRRPGPNGGDDGGYGVTATSILAALPLVLKAPRDGTDGVLWRPQPVHRLDKPTSGLLVVAKTRSAAADLSRQFAEGAVHKTYTAVCRGVPSEDGGTSLSPPAARRVLGVVAWNNGDKEDEECDDRPWQLIDSVLDGKSAVTVWRALGRLRRSDGGACQGSGTDELSVVELRPKTGRYHQLRRHMARTKGCPLLGDTVYGLRSVGRRADGAPLLEKHRQQQQQEAQSGLFLCCNELSFEHPFYNSDVGRTQWDEATGDRRSEHRGSGMICLPKDGSNKVVINVRIDLPDKFTTLLGLEKKQAM